MSPVTLEKIKPATVQIKSMINSRLLMLKCSYLSADLSIVCKKNITYINLDMRILGIDPSLCRTGWGIVDYNHDQVVHLAHGIASTKGSLSTEKRLASLSRETTAILHLYMPDIVCIEQTFCGINPSTTLRLGFASGAILSACGINETPVFTYATRLVKQLITNNGSSDKNAVRISIMDILKLDAIEHLDSSDALAVAVAHLIVKCNFKIQKISSAAIALEVSS